MSTERRFLWYGTIFSVLAVAWMLGACQAPSELFVRGVLTKVERDQRYEAPCGLLARARDPAICDVPPVCCSYHIVIEDSTGARTYFWAFWPKRAEGLREGETLRLHLHRRAVYRLPCSLFGCSFDSAYALDGDEDVNPVAR